RRHVPFRDLRLRLLGAAPGRHHPESGRLAEIVPGETGGADGQHDTQPGKPEEQATAIHWNPPIPLDEASASASIGIFVAGLEVHSRTSGDAQRSHSPGQSARPVLRVLPYLAL